MRQSKSKPRVHLSLRRWYDAVAKRAFHRCEYCHAPESFFNHRFDVEHIIPKARGDSTDLDNLALCCSACNSRKLSFEMGVDATTSQEVPLFNPRIQNWAEHFRFSADGLILEGLTPIGRATIRRLDMNHSRQVRARWFWMRFPELFP